MEKRIFTDPTRQQLRAARSWLEWSLDDAAAASGVHRQTIYKIEAGESAGRRETIRALVKAFADNGVWLDKGMMMHADEKERPY